MTNLCELTNLCHCVYRNYHQEVLGLSHSHLRSNSGRERNWMAYRRRR
nr:MAG TPA: hypothetical protein [Caudoviricetes sp.]